MFGVILRNSSNLHVDPTLDDHKVIDLMVPGTKCWDYEMIEELFNDRGCC